MTKLLEEAVARVRILPDDEQDRAAEVLMALAQSAALEPEDEATRVAIAEGLAQTERGEFASDEEIDAAYARFRE